MIAGCGPRSEIGAGGLPGSETTVGSNTYPTLPGTLNRVSSGLRLKLTIE